MTALLLACADSAIGWPDAAMGLGFLVWVGWLAWLLTR